MRMDSQTEIIRLRRRITELERQNEEIERFAAVAAHELLMTVGVDLRADPDNATVDQLADQAAAPLHIASSLLTGADVGWSANSDGALLPGMYAQVDLSSARANAPLLVPGDALIVLATGTQVAVVRPDSTVHLQKIEVGRDYGDRLEVLSGLHMGDRIIANPGDTAREGTKVEPVTADKSE